MFQLKSPSKFPPLNDLVQPHPLNINVKTGEVNRSQMVIQLRYILDTPKHTLLLKMGTFIAHIDAFQRWKRITASEKGDLSGLEIYTSILGEQTERYTRPCPGDLGIQQMLALNLNSGVNIPVPAHASVVVWRKRLTRR